MFLSLSRMKLIHILLWKFWKIQNDYTEENNTVLNFFFLNGGFVLAQGKWTQG